MNNSIDLTENRVFKDVQEVNPLADCHKLPWKKDGTKCSMVERSGFYNHITTTSDIRITTVNNELELNNSYDADDFNTIGSYTYSLADEEHSYTSDISINQTTFTISSRSNSNLTWAVFNTRNDDSYFYDPYGNQIVSLKYKDKREFAGSDLLYKMRSKVISFRKFYESSRDILDKLSHGPRDNKDVYSYNMSLILKKLRYEPHYWDSHNFISHHFFSPSRRRHYGDYINELDYIDTADLYNYRMVYARPQRTRYRNSVHNTPWESTKEWYNTWSEELEQELDDISVNDSWFLRSSNEVEFIGSTKV